MVGTRGPRGASPRAARRKGVAVVELALLLPLLAFLFVVAIDFARIFYYALTVTNCARNGAVYACDPTTAATNSPYKNVTEAALSDAGNLSPTPTVTSKTVADADGDYVEVTVTYKFSTITNYPFVSGTWDVTRTCKMRQVSAVPKKF